MDCFMAKCIDLAEEVIKIVNWHTSLDRALSTVRSFCKEFLRLPFMNLKLFENALMLILL